MPKLDISALSEDIQKNDSALMIARFNYQLEHYWDYFDYTDERMLYTPFYKNKLETWFTKVLYPSYDSIKPYVFAFLEEVKPSKRIFQFATSYFLNNSINSKRIGMDALFVDIAKVNQPRNSDDIPIKVLIPSFIISEVKTAFQIGFLLYVPFLIIDMVVASVLLSMGMMMLPPIMISLPFKLMVFVLSDGWYLLVGSLVKSFA